MQNFYPQELVDFISERIEMHRNGKLAPITAWKDCVDRLSKEKVAKQIVAEADDFIIHPSNRSGLGVNAYNVHRVGAMLRQIGVDPAELEKAVAFERMPTDPMKSSQVTFTQKLISSSKGMLAPMTGAERFCTVGTGHTTQFFKAMKAACSTTEPTLADPTMGGKMQAETLSQYARFHSALTKGWRWAVLPWQAEVTWSQLPDLAQRALNASNNVASLMSELEVCVSIAEFAELMPCGSSFGACVDAVKMNQPPCQTGGMERHPLANARGARGRCDGALRRQQHAADCVYPTCALHAVCAVAARACAVQHLRWGDAFPPRGLH